VLKEFGFTKIIMKNLFLVSHVICNTCTINILSKVNLGYVERLRRRAKIALNLVFLRRRLLALLRSCLTYLYIHLCLFKTNIFTV